MRVLVRLLLVLICLTAGQMAWSKDYILTRGLLIDPSGQMSVEEVEKGSFESSGADIVRGYSSAVLWLKIEVQATDRRLYLRIRPPFLDSVTLYWRDPVAGSGWEKMVSGDFIALNDRPLPFLSFVFPIDPSVQTTYFLRLDTTSTNIMSTEALVLEELVKEEMQEQFWQMVYYGLMFWILVWAIADFIIHRQPVVGFFVVAQLAQILYAWVAFGYLALMLPSSAIGDVVFSVLVLMVVTISLLFHRVLLAPFDPNKWAKRLTDLMILAGLLLQIVLWFGDPGLALALNGTIVAVSPAFLLGMALTAKRDDVLTRKALRWVYAIFSVSILLLVLPLFGLTQSFDTYKNGLILQGVVSAYVMTMFLFARSRKLQNDGMEVTVELARSEQQLVNERMRYLEQSKFMDVLTHELNTPVSVIKLTSDMVPMSKSQRERINRSVETISGFIERCRASLQLNHAPMEPVLTTTRLRKVLSGAVNASLEPHRILLSIDPSLELSTDPQLLGIVFQNLVDNALKYSPMKTSVQIQMLPVAQAAGLEDTVVIQFTNTLTPLAKPDPNKIFQKYYRGIGSIGESGNGVGLFLAQQLITMLGGEIRCRLGEGSISFLVTLPVNPR